MSIQDSINNFLTLIDDERQYRDLLEEKLDDGKAKSREESLA